MIRENVIEKMGSLFADFGLKPLMGRIFGLLLASEEALSLSQIAADLEVSKAAVSILIRQLESFGYCRKLPTKGNREHFYLLRENYLPFTYGRRISREMSQLDIIRELGDSESDAPAFIRERIGEFMAFNEFIIREQGKALEKWKENVR